MHIIEVKNNLVKINYDANLENISLSGFLVIKDNSNSFVAQVMHLEAIQGENLAILKLLLNFDEQGFISGYNGSIPDKNALVTPVLTQELLEIFPSQSPLIIGRVANNHSLLKTEDSILCEKLLVCSEKDANTKLLIKNFTKQLELKNKKAIVFDLKGDIDFCAQKLVAGRDFKLPLNYDTINFIYEKGLDGATAKAKALIQDVLLEVQNYVKTLEEKYVPFNVFKQVVDEQYEELKLVDLVLLKNKLLKYLEAGIFAQDKEEFVCFEAQLKNKRSLCIDLSNMEPSVQREFVAFCYNIFEKNPDNYVFLNVENSSFDKKLLKQIFSTSNTFTNILCPYSYKYLTELKRLSKNLIFFAPLQQQNDFASYNTFLQKLNEDEFIIYGKSTQHIPFIVSLAEIEDFSEIMQDTQVYEQQVAQEEPAQDYYQKESEVEEEENEEYSQDTPYEPSVDEQIKKDVDMIFSSPKASQVVLDEIKDKLEQNGETIAQNLQELSQDEVSEEIELSEEDLDFIDTLNFDEQEDTDQQDFQPEFDDEAQELYKEPSIENQDIVFEEITEQEQDIEEENEYPFFEEQESQQEQNSMQEEVEDDVFSVEELPDDLFDEIEEEIEEVDNQQEQEKNETESQDSFLGQQESPVMDILPASESSTPIIPIYSANAGMEENQEAEVFEQGDIVTHPKYGKGTVEKLIKYGSKTLCSINFDNVGRRLLDPSLAEIKRA